MKVVSKFKDYYDSLRAMDRENTPLYLRETNTFELRAMTEDQRFQANRLRGAMMPRLTYDTERCVLGFCGRLFPFFIVDSHVCYTHAQLVVAIEHADDDDGDGNRRRGDLLRHAVDLEAEWAHMLRRIDDEPFIQFRSPVLWLRESELVTNPILKALRFQTQVESYTAWQELSMFLGNNMVSASTVAPRPISDALKAEAKGFDPKTSFRNQKNRPKSDRGDW